jgi:hypothetical protein
VEREYKKFRRGLCSVVVGCGLAFARQLAKRSGASNTSCRGLREVQDETFQRGGVREVVRGSTSSGPAGCTKRLFGDNVKVYWEESARLDTRPGSSRQHVPHTTCTNAPCTRRSCVMHALSLHRVLETKKFMRACTLHTPTRTSCMKRTLRTARTTNLYAFLSTCPTLSSNALLHTGQLWEVSVHPASRPSTSTVRASSLFALALRPKPASSTTWP